MRRQFDGDSLYRHPFMGTPQVRSDRVDELFGSGKYRQVVRERRRAGMSKPHIFRGQDGYLLDEIREPRIRIPARGPIETRAPRPVVEEQQQGLPVIAQFPNPNGPEIAVVNELQALESRAFDRFEQANGDRLVPIEAIIRIMHRDLIDHAAHDQRRMRRHPLDARTARGYGLGIEVVSHTEAGRRRYEKCGKRWLHGFATFPMVSARRSQKGIGSASTKID